jgi:hypothetical protein
LQLPAFRLTLEAIRSARPEAVTTTAACALCACSGFRCRSSEEDPKVVGSERAAGAIGVLA